MIYTMLTLINLIIFSDDSLRLRKERIINAPYELQHSFSHQIYAECVETMHPWIR